MVGPATVSAAINVANFVIGQKIETEHDSTMLERFIQCSKENKLLGTPNTPTFVRDSPMITCLVKLGETANGKNPTYHCPSRIAYVFYDRKSQGKSSAARYFCRKNLKKSKCRSLLLSATGSDGASYFERIASNLEVNFSSNWARCLVSATTKNMQEDVHDPWLFLDEFNDGTEVDLRQLDLFMRACQNRYFYLIIITSDKEIADKIMKLNAWRKMRPLQYIHNGSIENIKGTEGYDENKQADWKEVDWTLELLVHLVKEIEGEFENYEFIRHGMTPTDALTSARKKKGERVDRLEVEDASSNLADDIRPAFCAMRDDTRPMLVAGTITNAVWPSH